MVRRINLKHTREAPLSEQEIVDATLAFANGSDLHMDGWPSKAPEVLESERQRIRGFLERIKRGQSPAVARELLEAGWQKWAPANRVMYPTSEGLDIRYFEEIHTANLLASYGVALVLSSREHRERLCQCQYSKCRRFFWKIQPNRGPPQRFYCCEEHMTKGHSERVARVARERRRKKAEARRQS